MTLYKWSQTASADATADSTINWAEGQAPSSVNDSARAMMAATAKYRDDIAGAIVTTGTSTAYAVLSYQGFDTLAHLSGQMIAFTPHVTNAATVTLNVDVLGAKPLRTAPGIELAAGVIIQGTPYTALYNDTDGAFYLQGVFGNPWSIPIAGGLDYWASTAPNSSFAFPVGQAISRTTYSALFALVGTIYGTGDGSTTFNLPDKRGRVSATVDGTGRLTSASMSSVTLGGLGGAETHVLTVAEIPSHSHSNTLSDPGHSHANSVGQIQSGSNFLGNVSSAASAGGNNGSPLNSQGIIIGTSGTGMSLNNASAGGSNAHVNVQPTITNFCSFLVRRIEQPNTPAKIRQTAIHTTLPQLLLDTPLLSRLINNL
jgi:microcystin-dependent protein